MHDTPTALREGFTTGSAATGAALAALQLLFYGSRPSKVRIPLPPFTGPQDALAPLVQPRAWLDLPVAQCQYGPAPELAIAWRRSDGTADMPPLGMARAAHALVIKDGGDDPDVTSGAAIAATVVETLPATPGSTMPAAIAVMGGPGVGRVTLPGLPLPVGSAAINPVPQAQVRFALGQALAECASRGLAARPHLTVYISVPQGRDLARKTLNPRLGILGGISILGTQGTVRPYSHEAWQATIRQSLHVARACGCSCACLATGRRSETLLMARYPDLPSQCFVQIADYAAFSFNIAGRLGFTRLAWGGFFGKLLKLAQGQANTHASKSVLDLYALAKVARREKSTCAAALEGCVTAASALELLLADPVGPQVLKRTMNQAAAVARTFAAQEVRMHLFHLDGREILTL